MSRLIVLAKHSSVRQINIEGPITTIGRAAANRLSIDSDKVSRHHAVIQRSGERYVLTDMGSRNGTYVNREKVSSRVLRDGDAITVGDCEIRFLCSRRAMPRADSLRLLTIPADLGQFDVVAASRRRPEFGLAFR